MKQYRITRCLHWHNEPLGVSINNPRCQEDAGTFPTRAKAELEALERQKQMEKEYPTKG